MRILSLALMLVVAGCTRVATPESVCEGIVRSVVVDPNGLKVNSIKTTAAALSAGDLDAYFSRRHPEGMSDSARKLHELRSKELSETRDMFVRVDYTVNETAGAIRDQALCRYIEWPQSATELVSFTVRNHDYSQDDFLDIFLQYGQPDSLTINYTIK